MVMFAEFFMWWYSKGWRLAAQNRWQSIGGLTRTFSVGVIVKTLFAPWKRIITPPGSSFDQRIRAIGDNMTSRAVGFFVRVGTLIGFLLLLAANVLFGFVVILLWPLMPLAAGYLIYWSIFG